MIAALTAQNTQTVTGVDVVRPEFIRLQIDTLFADVRIDAAKIGMLGTAATARAGADTLARPIKAGQLPHRVLDPVMIAKSGDALLQADAVGMLIEAVLPLATVLTPNLPETGVLLGARPPDSLAEMRRAAERLRRLLGNGECWVLVKGGHLSGAPIDVLHDGDRMIELAGERVETRNSHGTGCTWSAAIAALLPQRGDAAEAIRDAKRYLTAAMRAADQLTVGQPGKGHGPVHHFHRQWTD